MSEAKNFRFKDKIGPDYRCKSCGAFGVRLWRDSHVMLDQVDLFCAVCAEANQAFKIKEYKERGMGNDPMDCAIGNLLPARPTPEGDNLWGHSSGDTAWWYKLPQYLDPSRELAKIRLERDYFCVESENYGTKWMKSEKELNQAIRDRDEALRVAKLENYPK